MVRKLIRKSNIHDVKTMFWLILKAYIKQEHREDCMKQITALMNLLASDKKIIKST